MIFVLFLIDVGEKLEDCGVLSEWEGSFDVVISSAVYTQIFYIHVLTVFSSYVSNYSADEIGIILKEMAHLRDTILKNYNNIMLNLAKKGGVIVVWTDVVKLDEAFPFPEEQFYTQRTDEERMKHIFSLACEQGREAAVIGLRDLHDKLISTGRHFSVWRWPFNSNRHYITFGLSGRKN